MKIPKKLKIGGHIITIDTSSELTVNGSTHWDTNTIKICKTLCQTQKESTLIHEIFHIMNTEVGGNNHHALISSLAEQFYQVLKDNKLI